MAESLQNFVETAINMAAGLDHAATTVTVVDGTVFTATPNYRVEVGSEIMLVTARAGNDLTVTRGQEGTTATAHANGTAVTSIASAGAFNQWFADKNNDLFWVSLNPHLMRAMTGNFGIFQDGTNTGYEVPANNVGGASANGDKCMYTVDVPAGTYTIQLMIGKNVNRAQVEILLDNVQIGTWDGYNATFAPTALTFPGVVIAAGPHNLTFHVTGKNASSSGYQTGWDYLRLVQTA